MKEKKEKVVFFTFISDDYYEPIGTPKMINSFKRFHPDIDLVVFRQDIVDYMFKSFGFLNWLNAKPTFAKLLADKYDLVVNIDADSVILGRLESVLAQDYEVGAAWNYNDYENRKVKNVTEKMFVNAGMVASRKKEFWDIWEIENREAYKYVCAENDILNLIWYNNTVFRKKIFDKKKDYYGCKSLGREREFVIDNNKVMCRGEQVRLYHHAKGPGAMPKLQFDKMGFNDDVVTFMNFVSTYGKSAVYGDIWTNLIVSGHQTSFPGVEEYA